MDYLRQGGKNWRLRNKEITSVENIIVGFTARDIVTNSINMQFYCLNQIAVTSVNLKSAESSTSTEGSVLPSWCRALQKFLFFFFLRVTISQSHCVSCLALLAIFAFFYKARKLATFSIKIYCPNICKF